MAKLSKTQRQRKLTLAEKKERRIQTYIWLIPAVVFFIKMITMSNINQNIWLGADGENYLKALDGLIKDGFASKEGTLQYWPAGYPLLLLVLFKISAAHFFQLISIIQSLFYAFASYFFINALFKSPLKKVAFPLALFVSLNPTLSLSSLAVGYESPVAAAFMIAVALMFENQNAIKSRRFISATVVIGLSLFLAAFLQPRYMFVGLVLIVVWIFRMAPRKSALAVAALSIGIMSIAPALLIIRNSVATGDKVISTNLGVTMAIGAGDETSGGYTRTGPEVPCEPTPPATTTTDNQKVKCVIKWYLTHPTKTVKLAFTKSAFYWSPWSGPLANGTMARNPWLKINPVMTSWSKNQDGYTLVFGTTGKLVSVLWIVGQIYFVIAGFIWLWRNEALKRLGALLFTPVLLSWLISLGTIGDHRFRIPTMGLSLVLQVCGAWATARKFKALAND